jgi:hypothetical protein
MRKLIQLTVQQLNFLKLAGQSSRLKKKRKTAGLVIVFAVFSISGINEPYSYDP